MAVTVDCDLRRLFGPARDQNARPTCLAFAASDAHAAVRSGWQPLSCEYAYYHALLDNGSPVIVAMSISDTFYMPNNAGVVAGNEPPDPTRLHAVIAVGYGIEGGERLFLVRNSWGEFWGCDGYAWLTESYLAPRVIDLAIMQEST